MTFISVVINCDTRTGFEDNESTAGVMFEGCRNIDFMIEGVKNKQSFFNGFEIETILFIDEHYPLPEHIVSTIRSMVDTLVIRKHNKRFGDMKEYSKFNDLNYLAALQLARGQYIAHFDQDCAAFSRDQDIVQNLLNRLDNCDYVSYPSIYSPVAVADPSFDYMWASTRFFVCKRETLDFTELKKCLTDSDYMYGKYPASRRCEWTEHILGLLAKYNGNGVYYPPIELENYAVFCWNKYISGTLGRLNNLPYNEVKNYINDCGGIVYPCDIHCR